MGNEWREREGERETGEIFYGRYDEAIVTGNKRTMDAVRTNMAPKNPINIELCLYACKMRTIVNHWMSRSIRTHRIIPAPFLLLLLLFSRSKYF